MKIEKKLNDHWEFREAGKGFWRAARVPGNIHLDLMHHDEIDDPYWRDNELSQQWVGERDWEYQTQFELSSTEINMYCAELIFDGLDTYADIYLNGHLILHADNMYCGWRITVNQYLKTGTNHLLIYFHSAIKVTEPLHKANPFIYPANTSQPEPKLSVYSRKPGYHYGWDWGPRLVTAGIWRPVTLVVYRARLDDVQLIQESLTDERAELKAVVTIAADAARELTLRISDAAASFSPVEIVVQNLQDKCVLPFHIDHPKRWWTLGLGDQYLYSLSLELICDGEVIDRWQHCLGLRTVELVHESDDHGMSFYFKLNGESVFIKGANCIPADFFVPRLTREDYKKLLGYAVEANMNMLRLWGGAIYEEEIFYELCDELGILVWQDFMFACAAYPCDDVMAKRIAQEAEYNIKRLRNHTCLALWCGNNEISEGWHTWGWQKRYSYSDETCALIWSYYEKIFHNILPEAVSALDPDRPYWASSPKYGFVDERAKYDGDMHYWGVWFLGHARQKFEEYLPRFMSEYGLQSMPELKTFEAFSLPEDRHLQSQVMKCHQKQYANPSKNQFLDGYGMMIQYLEREYGVPENFEQLAYMTQLLQADYLGFAIKTHRRSKPYCMGTLYWQLNDMWPVTSWATVDYFGRWKAAHYVVRDAYKPVIITIAVDGESVVVHLISDLMRPVSVKIDLALISFDGDRSFEKSFEVMATANRSEEIFRETKESVLHGIDEAQSVFVAECTLSDGSRQRDLLYFRFNKALKLPDPELQVFLEDNDQTLVVKTRKLAKNIFIEADVELQDNYFDLLPGESRHFRLDRPLSSIKVIHYRACFENAVPL